MVAGAQSPAFDGALASTLFPAAVRLADLATHSTPAQAPGGTGAAQNEVEGTGKRPTATQEQLSAQAAALKRNLATLSAQAESLLAGQLGLEDQDWLIGQLEARVEQTRQALARMAELSDMGAGAVAAPAATQPESTGPASEDRMDTAA
ncbi:hypothetical protein JCM8202_000269 [Rhodotorula sphaerocarpa]